MNIILFGPPGAGKGTQSKYLEKKLNNFQVSTGDMLRDEIKQETEIGKKIINYMNDGKFVDDEIKFSDRSSILNGANVLLKIDLDTIKSVIKNKNDLCDLISNKLKIEI